MAINAILALFMMFSHVPYPETINMLSRNLLYYIELIVLQMRNNLSLPFPFEKAFSQHNVEYNWCSYIIHEQKLSKMYGYV